MINSPFNKTNRKVYSFIKQPEFKLEPQAQCILNIIQRESPLTRWELLHKLDKVMETHSTISKVLSYHQRFLVRFGCIRVETPDEHKQNTELKKVESMMHVKILRNTMGGYGIQETPDGPPCGHYPTVADAVRVCHQNCWEVSSVPVEIPDRVMFTESKYES